MDSANGQNKLSSLKQIQKQHPKNNETDVKCGQGWAAVVTNILILLIQTCLFTAREDNLTLKWNQIFDRQKITIISKTNPKATPKN